MLTQRHTYLTQLLSAPHYHLHDILQHLHIRTSLLHLIPSKPVMQVNGLVMLCLRYQLRGTHKI